MLLAEVLMLPAMLLFTALAGGYAILRHIRETKPRSTLRAIVVLLLIIVSAMGEFFGFVIVLLFFLFEAVRGFKLIVWGLTSLSERSRTKLPESATALRLIPSGVLLIAVSSFLFGMSVFSFNSMNYINKNRTERSLLNFVAYQLAYGTI